MRRAAALLAVAALVAGCGGAKPNGTATVWITRDRGAHVLVVRTVPSGLTAMQAVQRVASVKTRYGGRFVQSIDGVAGSLSARRDWFYFVNGYEADRGASEYTLHPGDVEWWDFRSWANGEYRVPVVVGAFPEPFLHGYGGNRRRAVVATPNPETGRALAKFLHARYVHVDRDVHVDQRNYAFAGRDENILFVMRGPTRFTATTTGAGGRVLFRFSGDWHDLLNGKYRYRYDVE